MRAGRSGMARRQNLSRGGGGAWARACGAPVKAGRAQGRSNKQHGVSARHGGAGALEVGWSGAGEGAFVGGSGMARLRQLRGGENAWRRKLPGWPQCGMKGGM